jgi:salicylate hydroxylase
MDCRCVAFTRAGHDVAVYEKSSFHNEVGAAIHLAPNATRVLKSWDCDFEAMQPSRCEGLDVWNSQGDFIVAAVVSVHEPGRMGTREYSLTREKRKKDVLETLGIDGDWLLVHRVDLHNYLRKKAEEGFNGKKPTIHLASALKSAVSHLFRQ